MNHIKPEGTTCPKCAGFYDWTPPQGRCLMCGYVYNPPLPVANFKIPHCCFGQCVRPIDAIEKVFCHIHAGEIVGESARRNIYRQQQYTKRKANQEDGQIRLNAPIMVKLKARYRKTVA